VQDVPMADCVAFSWRIESWWNPQERMEPPL
jgi:hypothetical protein